MLILTLRTDKPEAEIGLYDGETQLAYEKWQAHRELSSTIHQQIDKLLKSHSKDWDDLGGIVCFKGPGSFTGLRIGLTVGNALAYCFEIPVVAAEQDWIETGTKRLLSGDADALAIPEYGGEAFVTQPRK